MNQRLWLTSPPATFRPSSQPLGLIVILAVLLMVCIPAFGQNTTTNDPSNDSIPSFFSQKYVLGNWNGEGRKLEEQGVTFDFHYIQIWGAILPEATKRCRREGDRRQERCRSQAGLWWRSAMTVRSSPDPW